MRMLASPAVTSIVLDAKRPASYLPRHIHQGNGEGLMTQFDDRERAFETKFAHDEEMKFRITARRNRLLGEWAARRMGLTEAETEAYAKDVVRSDFEEAGEHDVIRKVLGDLSAAGVEIDDDQVRHALRNKEIDARRQIIESTNL
jgi:hypothetical protein